MFSSRDTTFALHRSRRRLQLADEAFESYLEWRDAASAASATYRRWAEAEPCERAAAFADIAAALDREQQAATRYGALLHETGALLEGRS
jgi:hypothetical protein